MHGYIDINLLSEIARILISSRFANTSIENETYVYCRSNKRIQFGAILVN